MKILIRMGIICGRRFNSGGILANGLQSICIQYLSNSIQPWLDFTMGRWTISLKSIQNNLRNLILFIICLLASESTACPWFCPSEHHHCHWGSLPHQWPSLWVLQKCRSDYPLPMPTLSSYWVPSGRHKGWSTCNRGGGLDFCFRAKALIPVLLLFLPPFLVFTDTILYGFY